jgi:hypothetical protein
MKIFERRDTWLILLGGNASLVIDNLTTADFVDAAINVVAAAACGYTIWFRRARKTSESQ